MHGMCAIMKEENTVGFPSVRITRVVPIIQAEVTQRLSNAKEAASKPAGLQSHEDLARKLQVNNIYFF